MTLSNALGPTDLDGRCLRLNDSDCGGPDKEPIEFDVDGIDPDIVADEVETSELTDCVVPAESGGG